MTRRDLLRLGMAGVSAEACARGAEPLVRSLDEGGLATHWVGDRILVLRHGGRVIGLFPASGRNVLWVNPILRDPVLLKGALAKPGWLNPGGDRTWISPEVEVFIGDPAHMQETYKFPPEIDPASYRVARSDAESVTLATPLNLTFMRSKREVRLQLQKTIRLLHQPPFAVPGNAPAAGYELITSIEATELAPRVRPGIWNSIQVPGGGTIRIPIRSGAKPRPFFGKPKYTIQNSLVYCRVKNPISSKLCIHARDSMGIVSYDGGAADHPYTVWRRFHVGAAEEYADVPCDDPKAIGYMTQSYVDDGKLGGFGEIEYHAPSLDAAKKIMRIESRSETWAFESHLPDESPWFKNVLK
jgi:hypothetical protein